MAGKTPNSKQVSSGPLEDIKHTDRASREIFQCPPHFRNELRKSYCITNAHEKIIQILTTSQSFFWSLSHSARFHLRYKHSDRTALREEWGSKASLSPGIRGEK